jgi:hypothetical protein
MAFKKVINCKKKCLIKKLFINLRTVKTTLMPIVVES